MLIELYGVNEIKMEIIKNVEIMDGVIEKRLIKNVDYRGHLIETFRIDELPEGISPVMSYVNFTQPGFWRGPHVHHQRTEIFAFPGPGNLRIVLWDNRIDSKTYLGRKIVYAGEDNPMLITIYPGIVHLIENISKNKDALIINYPNTLFKGWGRREEFTDEIRYENDDSIFWNDYLQIKNN